MVNKIYFLAGFCAFTLLASTAVWAQSAPIYNSSNSGYSSGGPLNLEQLLQGNQNAASGSRSQYYGSSSDYFGGRSFRPYGLDEPGSRGLSVTQDEVLRARAERDRQARERERENLAAMQSYNDELAAFERGQIQSSNPAMYRQPTRATTGATTTGRRVYNRGDQERFEKPRRVFNSLR